MLRVAIFTLILAVRVLCRFLPKISHLDFPRSVLPVSKPVTPHKMSFGYFLTVSVRQETFKNRWDSSRDTVPPRLRCQIRPFFAPKTHNFPPQTSVLTNSSCESLLSVSCECLVLGSLSRIIIPAIKRMSSDLIQSCLFYDFLCSFTYNVISWPPQVRFCQFKTFSTCFGIHWTHIPNCSTLLSSLTLL